MKFSLSTNWCNQRLNDGEAIAEKALSLGFEELELGYNTTPEQVPGFRKMLDRIPVGSVHAFCPVPLSAPQGYPELYQLASLDEEARKMAVLQGSRGTQRPQVFGNTARSDAIDRLGLRQHSRKEQ